MFKYHVQVWVEGHWKDHLGTNDKDKAYEEAKAYLDSQNKKVLIANVRVIKRDDTYLASWTNRPGFPQEHAK